MRIVSILLFILLSLVSVAQEDSTSKKLSDYLRFSGYIKSMQIASFADNLDEMVNDNLIHNRLNFKIYPHKNMQAAFEVRTRVFYGESVDASPLYGEYVDYDAGYYDLSYLLVDEPSLVMLTQIDRAWIEWSKSDWEIRIGRQRINWGTNLFWNPNDVFNAYSLVDFDYEERPGTDAIRIQRHFEDMKAFELAIKPGKDSADWIGAAMYKFNKWQYDFQLLGGWWYNDYVVGAGWAGNIKSLGFKGESTAFIPEGEGDAVFSTSISFDYVFGNQMFITGGFLHNSAGIDSSFNGTVNPFTSPLSAKNLLPMKYSGILGVTYPISPVLNAGLTGIYSPGVNTAFFMPSFGYSIASNWEIALFGQSFWMELDKFRNAGNGIYLRIRGSF